MGVRINSNSGFGESVNLEGEDAARFMRELTEPSTDERRLNHLKRSDEAYERYVSPEPIHELPVSDE